MKVKLSLKQTWSILILFSAIVPASILMAWYGQQLYNTQLNYALTIENQANESLQIKIESEVKRLKTLFQNKSEPLSYLLKNNNQADAMQKINELLRIIIKREESVREIMVLSNKAEIIAAIDPMIGINGDKLLLSKELQVVATHWGIDKKYESPEVIIPSMGRIFISPPQKHDDFMAFSMSFPIGVPAKAVLIAVLDINKLWPDVDRTLGSHESNIDVIQHYMLSPRGSLLTAINNDYKPGSLMTHMPITRTALINEKWSAKTPYIGITDQLVFGTITNIPSLNWTLVTEVISSKITQPIWNSLLKITLLTLLGIIVFIWFILYLANKTLKPIQSACSAIDNVAKGNYHLNLRPCGIQELDALALGFNQMVKTRQEAEEKLLLLARIFTDTNEGIVITDANNNIIDVNPAFSQITHYKKEEVIGKNPSVLSSGKQSPEFYKSMWQTINEHGHWQGEVWNRKKNGELYAELLSISTLKGEHPNTLNYIALSSNITKIKEQQNKLELMAHYDVLTQLPNRALFADRFTQAIAHCKRNKSLLSVCFLDLDHFKPINDNFGHNVGDQLLIEVAQRILKNIRAEDTVSRQGGDEFALLLGDIQSFAQCEQMLKRIHHSLAQPYFINGECHNITASTGVTLYPLDNADIDTLMRHADQAMYQAKLAGRHSYRLFNTEQDKKNIEKNHQLDEIQHALTNNEFCLYYQPKVNIKTGEVFGAEALIRWLHPQKGLIPPFEFLPTVEGTELEISIGNWVINEALQQLNLWHKQGIPLEISINISSNHLQSSHFVSELKQALAKNININAKFLQLEILESSALGDLLIIRNIIKTCIEELGVGIALDDFGTGYSSLTHLKSLSADTIKVDQTFVRDMLDDPDDYAIINGILGLASAFDRKVIAEGVETTEHGLMLLIMGCKQAQGYGIARPMPANALPEWLKNYKPNQEWLACGDKESGIKSSQLKLFSLALSHWFNHFEKSISLPPDNIKSWSMISQQESICGHWIKRIRQDKLFESNWLNELEKTHKILHEMANYLHDKYQHGDLNAAREGLKEMKSSFNKLTNEIEALSSISKSG